MLLLKWFYAALLVHVKWLSRILCVESAENFRFCIVCGYKVRKKKNKQTNKKACSKVTKTYLLGRTPNCMINYQIWWLSDPVIFYNIEVNGTLVINRSVHNLVTEKKCNRLNFL